MDEVEDVIFGLNQKKSCPAHKKESNLSGFEIHDPV